MDVISYMRSVALPIAAAGLLAQTALAATQVEVDVLNVSGQVQSSATFTYGSSPLPLAGLPAVTETIGSNTYKGVSLYGLLASSAVGIAPNPTQSKNGFLAQYVVARAADGYRVVFSGGELDPGFGGNPALPNLVAYEINGGPIGVKGAFRTPVPEDVAGARNVQNLTDLIVYNAPARTGSGGGVASGFTLSGQVAHPGSFTDLTGMGLTTRIESVSYLSGSSTVNTSFTGVSLWSFLAMAGLVADPNQPSNLRSLYVLATGSDGYRAVFSMGELDPGMGGAAAGSGVENLIAWANGNGALLGSDGAFQLVVPGDVKGGRYIHNLVSLEVLAAPVPEPESFVLILAGLALLASVTRRRKNR